MGKLEDMLERAWDYYHEHETEIESSNIGDGSNYILKELYNALLYSINSMGMTYTVRTKEDRDRNHTAYRNMEVCRDHIVRAICEVIDSD